MRITSYVCFSILILIALLTGLSELTRFDIVFFLCAENIAIYRIVYGIFAVCALWLLFFLIAFKPLKRVS